MKSRDGWIEEEPDWLGPLERHADPSPPEKLVVPRGDGIPIVIWLPVICPFCRAKDCPVTKTSDTTPGMRYHQCRGCNQRFKSFENLKLSR